MPLGVCFALKASFSPARISVTIYSRCAAVDFAHGIPTAPCMHWVFFLSLGSRLFSICFRSRPHHRDRAATSLHRTVATYSLRQSKQPSGSGALRIPVVDDLQEMMPKRQRRLNSPRSVETTTFIRR